MNMPERDRARIELRRASGVRPQRRLQPTGLGDAGPPLALARGRDRAGLHPLVHVLAHQAANVVAQRRRQQVDAQVRGADGVGLVDDLVAATVEALQRQREGEGEEKGEQAEGRGLRQVDVRAGGLVRSFLDADADAIADLERGHGGNQQDAGDQADVDVVHELLHGTPSPECGSGRGVDLRDCPRSIARSEGSGQEQLEAR